MNKYLSSTELIKKYPALTNRLYWTKHTLRFLMSNKILTGYYIRNTRTTMILQSSIVELMRFMKQQPKEQEEIITETL
jgi:hypothetical protein